MNRSPREKLLRDILKETSKGFRQEVLEASLKELRRRKSHAKARHGLALAIAAGFALSAGLLLLGLPNRASKQDETRPPASLQTGSVSGYAQIEIVTNRGPGMAIVESRQYQSLIVQNSSIREPVEILGDTELLALFPNEPAGLIAVSHGSAQLVLLDGRDRTLSEGEFPRRP